MIARDEVWLRAWCANASAPTASVEGSTRFADECLKAFEERFPRLPMVSTWCGTPINELSDEQRAEMQDYVFGNLNRMTAGGR